MVEVFILSDIRLYREGLGEVADRSRRIKVVGTAADVDQALERIASTNARVVLLDAAMHDALATAKALVKRFPELKVMVLGVAESGADIVACAEAGVSGYLHRDGSLEELVTAIESVVQGELQCSSKVAAALMQRVARLASTHTSLEGADLLTPRELQVLELVDRGLTNKEIAGRLGVATSTTRNHIHRILEKLQVHRRGEAAAKLRGMLSRSGRRLRTP